MPPEQPGIESSGASGERDASFADMVELLGRRIVTSVVLAAAIVGLAIYARPAPPKYQIVAGADGQVVRVNTRSGDMIACDAQRCFNLHRPGGRIERKSSLRLFQGGEQKALPAQPPAAPAPPKPTS